MPIFFQHQINESTKLAIWQIAEPESFFTNAIKVDTLISNEKKRLQHLAGRYLLQYMEPSFPVHSIVAVPSQKPFLPNLEFHFSISHCHLFAAAIISNTKAVGIDVEQTTERVLKISHKFLSKTEETIFSHQQQPFDANLKTLLWSAKESVFKWYGAGGVDFKEHIQCTGMSESEKTIECFFSKTQQQLSIAYRQLDGLQLTWVYA